MNYRARRHKYGAVKVELDGYRFNSKAEAARYGELKLLKVRDLVVHPEFTIEHRGVKICRVVLDFSYFDGKMIFEDVKGVDTAVSRLKRRLLKAFFGIEVSVLSKKPKRH